MRKYEIQGLDTNIYKETLENGLLVYICPLNKNDAHASLVTKFGSDVLEFIPRGKKEYIKIPEGTAHFLEHKMFEMENGIDPMILYSNNGASSNAYTSSNVTRYYFTGASHFFENLKILLDCLNNPYFTKENIKKEQGIIGEEINTSLDNPSSRIYYLANKNLFKTHPHKNPVLGTKESINKLTENILYDTYNTFYHPSNMYLVITGKVDPKQTIKFIKDYYKNIEILNKDKIKTKKYKEPEKVFCNKKEEKMDITNKFLAQSYKVKVPHKRNKFLTNLYILLYLDILFSEISPLFNENHNDKNILTHVGYFTEEVDDYIIIHFDTEVIDSEDILTKIDKEINKKEFTEEDFNLILKNILKSTLMATEDVLNMAHIIVNQELNYDKFYTDFYNIYKNLKYKDCIEFIKTLDFSNKTIGIIKSLD